MTQLLEGLTILDVSHGMAGSLATMLFRDNGARVIKIEPPQGDPYRDFLPFKVWNRGKESVVLDLADPSQKENFFHLCRASDALIHSFRPVTVEEMGIDYASIHKIAPHLIYTALTGYGMQGSRRDNPGYEALVQARFGVFADQSGAGPGPHFCPQPGSSSTAAILAVLGTLAAIQYRNATGKGQLVDTSLEDGLALQHVMYWGWSDQPMVRIPPGYSSGKLIKRTFLQLGIMACSDGRKLMIHTGAPGRFTKALEVFGLADRVAPSGTLHEMNAPLSEEEAQLIETEVKRQLVSKPRSYWIQRIQEADIAVTAVDHLGQALSDPQAIHNGAVGEIVDADRGRLHVLGPVLMTDTSQSGITTLAAPPDIGEHTEDVVSEFEQAEQREWNHIESHGLPAKSPLEGVKIVDFGAFFAGPFGPKMLSDLGAEVIKVEPLQKDPMRSLTGTFAPAQRGKKCIALDLKSEEGRQIAYSLVREADMVSQNMRPSTADKLGISFDQLREINHNLVYLYAPGWGSTGPKANLQSFAPLLSAHCGLMAAAGGKGNEPVGSASGNEDTFNALLGACGLLMGLIKAAKTGKAQYIESPQLNSTLFATSEVVTDENGRTLFGFESNEDQTGFGPLYRIYQCRDGWICLVAIREKEWNALLQVDGLQALANDVRFKDVPSREVNAQLLAEMLKEWFRSRRCKQAIDALQASEVPCEYVYKTQNIDYFFDQENLDMERVVEYPNPNGGMMREIGKTIRFSGLPGPELRPFPRFGEHTEDILRTLGYTKAEIVDLHNRGVVASE